MKKLMCLLLTICMMVSASAMCVGAEEKEIEFTQMVFDGQLIVDLDYTVIRNVDDLDAFLAVYRGYGSYDFSEFTESLSEEYFNEKALVVSVFMHTSSCESFAIESVTVNTESDDMLQMKYSFVPNMGDIMEYKFIIAEVNQADIAGVEYVSVVKIEDDWDGIDFKYDTFRGELKDSALEGYENSDLAHGVGFTPILIQTQEKLDDFIANSCEQDNNQFVEYAESLPENYFDENAMLVSYSVTSMGGYGYEVTSVNSHYRGISMNYIYSGGTTFYDAITHTIIAAEFKKADVNSLDEVYPSNVSKSVYEYIDNTIKYAPSLVCGDIDNDFEITASDYLYLKRIYFGTASFDKFNGDAKARADIDRNGKFEAIDYILLKRAYFGTHRIISDLI